jgi:hypothetical protein
MSYHFYDMGFKDGYKKALQQLDEQQMGGGVLPGDVQTGPGGGMRPVSKIAGNFPSRAGGTNRRTAGPVRGEGQPQQIINMGGVPTQIPAGLPKPASKRLQWPWKSTPGEIFYDDEYDVWRWVPTGEGIGEYGPYYWDGERWQPGFGPMAQSQLPQMR